MVTAPTTNPSRRRYRISRGFGRPPRFVLASSALDARLVAHQLERAS